MDDRSLRELELLAVARLYGLAGRVTPAAAPPASPPAKTGPPTAIPPPNPRPAPVPPRAEAPSGGEDRKAPDAAAVASMDWAALEAAVAACRSCTLCEKRKQAVFGVGDRAAPWLFVGEGPGADEDEQGEPFVGQAGKLLDAMLAALRIARGPEAYIANVVKCRPPGNRVPAPEEALACAPYLDRQIALLRPKLIVALGKTAALRLTGQESSLASLRGRTFTYQGIPLVVTYHPAYLLRNLPDKAKAWEDLLHARRVLAAAS